MFGATNGISSMDHGTKTQVWDCCIIVIQVCSNKGHPELSMSLQYGGGKWKLNEFWIEIRAKAFIRNVIGMLSPLAEHSS